MEWFSITWVFGIITFACAFFFLQMLIDYNGQRGIIMPALKQAREVRERHATEIEKVDRLTKEAEAQLVALNEESKALNQKIKALDEEMDVRKKADSDEG
jgi:chromosome segregation ATPase